MIKKRYFLTIVMLACLVVILAPLNAQATTLTFGLDYPYCAHAPDGTAPWLTATFDDGGSKGSVNLTLSSSGLVNEEYVASWYFNLGSGLDDDLGNPSTGSGGLTTDVLSIQPVIADSSYDAIYAATKIRTGHNSFHAASDGAFDILFDFSQNASNNNKRFLAGFELKYTITGANLSAQSFNSISEANGGSDNRIFYSAAHVLRSPYKGHGNHDDDYPNQACGWIADSAHAHAPEPCTMLLLGSGLISMAGFIRKFKK